MLADRLTTSEREQLLNEKPMVNFQSQQWDKAPKAHIQDHVPPHTILNKIMVRCRNEKQPLERNKKYYRIGYSIAATVAIFIIGFWIANNISSSDINISAPMNDKLAVMLPDSSEVWLNAGSSILYPETFAKDKRQVILNGEAYFSVKKDTASPFIVETSQLSVKVLGTRFNVKAYPNDEKITTTLTSGKVEVSVRSQPPHILKPDEQLTYDKKSSDIHISVIDTNDTNCWMAGKLVFTNASAGEIFRTLERHYNTTIDNTAIIPASKRYTVKFLKDESLNEILNILKDIIGFDYQQYEKKIVLTRQ